MNLKKIAWVASLALALSTGLKAETLGRQAGRWESWVTHYYLNPQPSEIVQAVHGLSETGYFERQGNVATAIGFLSQVFAENPGQVESWLVRMQDLPRNHRRLVASAAWYSGHPAGAKMLRELSTDSSIRDQIQLTVSQVQPNVSTTPVLSESSMNLHWGAFLATGGEQHITSILTGMGRGELADSARVVLAFNASQHARVLEICREQLDRQPNAVRSILRAVINDAEGQQAKPPTT